MMRDLKKAFISHMVQIIQKKKLPKVGFTRYFISHMVQIIPRKGATEI